MTRVRGLRTIQREFLLTCLLRGMTRFLDVSSKSETISTHMPLARHDQKKGSVIDNDNKFLLTCLLRGMTEFPGILYRGQNFYSHASCEAWLVRSAGSGVYEQFLLTCLLRGMTRLLLRLYRLISFLLTCLLRGMTSPRRTYTLLCQFLLTCLLRGMTLKEVNPAAYENISTHMPLARHDGV